AQRQHLNTVWHRLTPWPDSVAGLTQLKQQFTITTLSNGNFSLLTAMAKHAGLPWDCIVSAELFQHYKPDPETYQGVARLLNLPTSQMMLCASHPSDLRAARAQGMKTAYVMRPFEFGEHVPLPAIEPGEFDLVAQDFVDLARQLNPSTE
ncbi:MAG TPA: HAD-IA family hydrolase, partial [Limnobacter sp.]|nr:HAD-IA family hydrolase [Limnobacter sp.]